MYKQVGLCCISLSITPYIYFLYISINILLCSPHVMLFSFSFFLHTLLVVVTLYITCNSVHVCCNLQVYALVLYILQYGTLPPIDTFNFVYSTK